jgi:hypothetical protein
MSRLEVHKNLNELRDMNYVDNKFNLSFIHKILLNISFRDRPFNLKGGRGYGFLFRSEIFFRTTQELEYLFILSRKARIFFLEFNIRLYDKNSESDYFFSSTKIRIFF